jgi:branched-chain amino acid aminotransferase
MDGEIIPAAEARVSVFDHGLLYGDGVFEGLRFYHGVVFMLVAHLERLQRSALAIGLELPYSRAEFADAIGGLIARYGADSGYLRLVVTRGPGSLGIDPRSCPRPVTFIIADALRVLEQGEQGRGVSLHVARTRRMPAACLDPAIKSLNYLNNILARIEANRAGMDEALMLNLDGHVSEGSVDNVFVVSGGVLRTPPLGDGMLAGITRRVVIDSARELGIRVDQRSLTLDELLVAEECFLTGTGAELVPVARIGDHRLPEVAKPLTPVIMREFRRRIERECMPRRPGTRQRDREEK